MTGESAESFLGTQGYVWDTQSDMEKYTVRQRSFIDYDYYYLGDLKLS